MYSVLPFKQIRFPPHRSIDIFFFQQMRAQSTTLQQPEVWERDLYYGCYVVNMSRCGSQQPTVTKIATFPSFFKFNYQTIKE